MAKRYWGSINLDQIKEAIKGGVEPFEGKKGKYVPVTIWVEDQPDQFGNSMSITMYNKDTKETWYLANLKEAEGQPGGGAAAASNEPDLPF